MVLGQKPLQVQNEKCLEIQTNTDDIEDNKLCLETLKARKVSSIFEQITITVIPNGSSTSVGVNLANNVGGNAGQPLAEGYVTGFMQYTVTVEKQKWLWNQIIKKPLASSSRL